MIDHTKYFHVGQPVRYLNKDFDVVDPQLEAGAVTKVFSDHIIVHLDKLDIDLWLEYGFNMDCLFPEFPGHSYAESIFDNEETQHLLELIGKEEANRLFSYEMCELDPTFIGFLDTYRNLADFSKDYAIIDFGCYQAFQAAYFKDHEAYIGVEPAVPLNARFCPENASHFKMSGQRFIEECLPIMVRHGLDLDKTIAVCSWVPDRELWKLVEETFPNYRIKYGDVFFESLSEKVAEKEDVER